MSRIYWDTMLFIYWLEDNPTYSPRVSHIYNKMRERRDTLCTSAFTIGEVLTGPYRRNAFQAAAKIREFFRPPHVEVLPFTAEAADRYAHIRSEYKISPADAIQLATASNAGVDLVLTNDHNLVGKVMPGIDFIAPLDIGLF